MSWVDPFLLVDEARRLESASGSGNVQRARRLYQQAADSGHAPAMVHLGMLEERFAESRAALEIALGWYGRAAAEGDPDGLFQAGRLRSDLGDWEEALPDLSRAADLGHPHAEVWCAVAMEEGHDSAPDPASAIAVYERLRSVVPYARIRLANCLYLGVGVERDRDRARALYREAVQGGDEQAEYGLGMIALGEDAGVEDWVRALPFFERAARTGLASACDVCGRCHAGGWAGVRDAARALPYLRRAAAFGFPDATATLGGLHLRGDGVPRDPAAAHEHLVEAAARGSAYGMYLLGLTYARGDGVPRDERLSREWLQRAAAAGYGEGE